MGPLLLSPAIIEGREAALGADGQDEYLAASINVEGSDTSLMGRILEGDGLIWAGCKPQHNIIHISSQGSKTRNKYIVQRMRTSRADMRPEENNYYSHCAAAKWSREVAQKK